MRNPQEKIPEAVAGIDPDTKGGLCLYIPDERDIEYFNFPGLKNKMELYNHMEDFVSRYNILHVGLEKQGLRPTDGKKGYGTLMAAYHVWETVLVFFGLSYEMVVASTWQKKMCLESDGNDSKERAFTVSKRMFPGHHFMNVGKKGKQLTTRNQGIADATMIAVYTKRYLL